MPETTRHYVVTASETRLPHDVRATDPATACLMLDRQLAPTETREYTEWHPWARNHAHHHYTVAIRGHARILCTMTWDVVTAAAVGA